MDNLEASLHERFTGRMLTIDEIYVKPNVGIQDIKRNYKTILTEMEKYPEIIACQ
jgi:hypothetical protein